MTDQEQLRVLIADDDAGMRTVMRKIIAKVEGFTLVAEAGDGKTTLELTEQLKALPAEPDDARAERGLALLTDYDHRIKALLTEIFGGENDFDKVLEGVNLAGTGANGKRVVQNLLDALTPILQEGAAQHLQTAAANARAEADAARAAREQA